MESKVSEAMKDVDVLRTELQRNIKDEFANFRDEFSKSLAATKLELEE
jgi:sRNA-binding carbon storage regulator CsrA